MIKKSFIFLGGIGPKKEKELWSKGIKDWNLFIRKRNIPGISQSSKKLYDCQLREASKALSTGNSKFFVNILKSKDTWRLYSHFREECCFLDIETTGVKSKDEVIAVGLFDGLRTKTMIKGINFNPSQLSAELKRYKLLVTFNGSSFDLPFLNKRFPRLIPSIPHIDLKDICISLGFKNGLKEIEKQFGILRNPLLRRMHSGDVYRLWRIYFATADEHYLNLLVEYNEEDVISLRKIADHTTKTMQDNLLKPQNI